MKKKNQKLEQFNDIRKYFNPIQPSVRFDEEKVIYQEFEPVSQLQNLIHCYWKLNTKQRLNYPFNYRVVSDGCIDVFFNLRNSRESFVMGFCNTYTEFDIGKEFSYGGIRFYPSIFPLIFGISAKTFANKYQALQLILPYFAEFISANLNEEFLIAIPKINQFICSIIQEKEHRIDDRFYIAFIEILKKKGNLETEKELNTGLSPRQLRRFFNHYIGTSPKSFCQIVRFQYILNAKPSSQSLRDNKIFFDVGFFDQAHFIKNFTKFYGVTPSKAFR